LVGKKAYPINILVSAVFFNRISEKTHAARAPRGQMNCRAQARFPRREALPAKRQTLHASELLNKL
jgi:hypothetical protein